MITKTINIRTPLGEARIAICKVDMESRRHGITISDPDNVTEPLKKLLQALVYPYLRDNFEIIDDDSLFALTYSLAIIKKSAV
jgi:hypothetical protein